MPGQTTKMAQTLESMFHNVAYRPTVYRTGGISNTPRHFFQTSKYRFNFHDIKAKLTWKINQKFPMDFQTQKCPEKVQ